MKNKNIFYISLLGFKRNKVSKFIIINFVFAMIFFIISLFSLLCFSKTIPNQIEGERLNLQAYLENEYTYDEIVKNYNVSSIKYIKKNITYFNIKEIYKYPKIIIDNKEYELSYEYKDYDIEENHRIYLSKTNVCFYYYSENMNLSLNDNNVIIKGIRTNKLKELMISSLILDYLHIDYNSVINKYVTLYNGYNAEIENYKITGIYNYRIFCKDVIQEDPLFILGDVNINPEDKLIKIYQIQFGKLNDEINAISKYHFYARDCINNYEEIKPIIDFITRWLIFFCAFFCFIACINLFIQVKYFIDSKMGFKKIMLLNGMKKYEYKLTLICQISLYLLTSFIISLPIGIGGCIALYILYNIGLDDKISFLGYGMSNLVWSTIISLGLIFMISVLFVLLLDRSRCKKI